VGETVRVISFRDPAVDVLIHVADGVVYEGLDYAVRIEERLSAAGLKFARRDLTMLPVEEPQSARAHVLTGGATSVLSKAQWMRSAIDAARLLVAKADLGECSVIGICLGSQILAEALRPGSILSAEAIEVGLTTVSRAEDDRIRQTVPSFHYESISPQILSAAGTRIEWRNVQTPVQAFTYRERTFGYQFHPELTVTDVHNLIDYHGNVITQQQGDVAAAHRSVEHHAATLSAGLFRRTVIDRVSG
jgi:GMP synthase-like glutamine amidotransferase